MTERTRTVFKVGSALITLAVAGFLFIKGEALFVEDAAPDTEESKTHWYCPGCAKGFSLTGRETEGRIFRGAHPGATTEGPRDTTRVFNMMPCPTCGKGAVVALKCPADETIFQRRHADGAPTTCPACGWDPSPRDSAEPNDE